MGLGGISTLLALMVSVHTGDDPAADRLYGRVLTNDGDVYVGYLRWDRNEAAWTDFLDGGKAIPLQNLREAESLDPDFAAEQKRRRSLVAFGVRITWDEDDPSELPIMPSAIRFAHVRTLTVLDTRRARIELDSGPEVILESTSTDVGRGMRGVVIEGADRGDDVTVRWRDLDRVDFMRAPDGMGPPRSTRLYGTLTTEDGQEMTGYVAWDLDEALDSDILDGRSSGRDHEIPFGEIVSIAWESDRSSRVVLRSGEELVLRGSNDVDRDNRGIEISDPTFGRRIVHWHDFGSLRFHAPGAPAETPVFDAGASLVGTVYAIDGRVITGEIRWNNDESQRWEVLDGWLGGVELDVEFGVIAQIDKIEDDRVVVTLRDGRTFELEDSGDFDEDHRGVFVKPEGRARRLVRWRDFDRVVFEP